MENDMRTGIICMALLVSATANAEWSGNIGWTSDYYYRGIFQASSSASGGIDYSKNGFYAGTWAADVGDGLEIDGFFGFGSEIGGLGGLIVVLSIVTLDKLRLDDSVGAISVHGAVGMWGLLAVPIFNESAKLWIQLVGLLSIFFWVFITSFVVCLAIKAFVGIRVDEQQEYEGVDLSECGLEAYPEFTVVD